MDLAHHYATSLRAAEWSADSFLRHQQRDPSQRDYGGSAPPGQGYVEPCHSPEAASALLTVYLNPDASHCGNPQVLDSARLYLEHALQAQHPDGTIDLRCTNFHCSSTVAFTIHNFGYMWRLLEQRADLTEAEAQVRDLARRYILAGAEGMLNGGFHTPNHRWVLVSALSLLYRILGDDRLRVEAERYLAEGIDCDEFGEYTERSVGVYNIAVNRSLLIAAEELERPELLDHVAANLNSVQRYWEPDDTLYTYSSRRQDYGTEATPQHYYDNYLLAGLRLNNPEYLYLADRIHGLVLDRGQPVNALLLFMSRPDLRHRTLETRPATFSCHQHNTRAGVVRIREGDRSLSLLANNTHFLKYQVGGNSVYLRCATTFFGDKGRLISERIESRDDGYRLHYTCDWGYKRPLDSAPASPLWEDLDHGSRADAQMQHLDLTCDVQWEDGDVVLDLRADGPQDVLLKLDFIYKPGGVLDVEGLQVPGLEDGYALHKASTATYALRGDRIAVSEGMGEHAFARTMRGGEDPDLGTFTVYMTGYIPVSRQIRLAGQSGSYLDLDRT